jgi:ArsR family transcriptional regulator
LATLGEYLQNSGTSARNATACRRIRAVDTYPSKLKELEQHIQSFNILHSTIEITRERRIANIRIFEYSANGMPSQTNERVLQLQAGICKVLSNPRRLQIMHELRGGEKTVSELTASTGMRQANVSQHLALMRLRKIVIERRVGNTVFYKIADNRITKACDIMRSVLLDQASAESKLVQSVTVPSR